jgi:excinuclease UvrABC nuclease subunit
VSKIDFNGIPEKPGLYFLFEGERLSYIGQSKNLTNRIRAHCSDSVVNHFDRVSFAVVEEEENRLMWEAELIAQFKPLLNVRCNPDWRSAVEERYNRRSTYQRPQQSEFLKFARALNPLRGISYFERAKRFFN